MYLVTHFYGVKYSICVSHFFHRLQTMFLILLRLAIWLGDVGTESHCLLVTGFHSSPTTELKACRVTPLPTHTDKNTRLTGRHMWAVHHRVQLCVYDRKADRGWMKGERQQENRKKKMSFCYSFLLKNILSVGDMRGEGGINFHVVGDELKPKRKIRASFPQRVMRESIHICRSALLKAVSTYGRGGLKYAGQIGLCQLGLQS